VTVVPRLSTTVDNMCYWLSTDRRVHHRPVRPRESERGFQEAVVALARLTGWLVYHTYDSRRSAAGFPDLVLVRGSELVVRELKVDGGRVSPAQRRWLDALGGVETITAGLWTPADWSTVERMLR
jgi:VRR-NUC domain